MRLGQLQGLMLVLPVQVHPRRHPLPHRPRGDQHVVDEGAGAPFRGDFPADDDVGAVGVAMMAWTEAAVAPVRTMSAEARPPRSRPMPSTSTDLPAPVSPVSTVRPRLERQVERLDDRELADADEPDHGRNDAGRRAGLTLRSNGQNCHDIIELTLIFSAWYACVFAPSQRRIDHA